MSKRDFNSHSHFRSFCSQPDYTNDLPPDQLEMIYYGETPKEKKRKKKSCSKTLQLSMVAVGMGLYSLCSLDINREGILAY